MRTALLLVLLLTLGGWAEDKPDVALLKKQVIDWVPVDYAAFTQNVEKAKAAGLEEADTLLPLLDASLLFGEVDKLKQLAPAVEKAQADIARRRGGTIESRQEVARSLKLAKQFLALAEKRPSEVAHRAEMFRMFYYAQVTLEHARMLDAAVDQYAIEKSVKEGTTVTWEQIRGYLKDGSQIATTGATIFGDKFGPYKCGASVTIPVETYQKLKAYLPVEAWGDYAPK